MPDRGVVSRKTAAPSKLSPSPLTPLSPSRRSNSLVHCVTGAELYPKNSDKNGINAGKLLGIPFTTAVGILIRSWEKGLLEGPEALAKLALLAKHGRYKNSILEDARLKLEVKP